MDSLAYKYMTAPFRLVQSLKSGGVNLVLCAQTLPLSKQREQIQFGSGKKRT